MDEKKYRNWRAYDIIAGKAVHVERGKDMFKVFEEQPVITAVMTGFMALSMLLKIMLGALYQGMIREADNMAVTENRQLRQCKVKFANCYQLNHGVANIPVFVDKFLNRLSLGPFSFQALYHLSGQTMILSVIASGVGVCRSIAAGHLLGEILPFYITSCAGLYFYFSLSSIIDINHKKRVLKINLIDYLENHLSARMETTRGDLEMLYGEEDPLLSRYLGSRICEKQVPVIEHPPRQQEKQPESLSDNRSITITEEELEALIKEFC